MRDRHEKILLFVSTLCIFVFFLGFIYLVFTGKTVSVRGTVFRRGDTGSLLQTKNTLRSSNPSAQSLASTGDTNTLFFGGRILTNPDSWSYRRTGAYHCPAIEFYNQRGLVEERIMTVVDQSFCNAKKVEVPRTLEIFPRGNLLFYIHTQDEIYIETIRILVESTQ
jgi:hypothetical protein